MKLASNGIGISHMHEKLYSQSSLQVHAKQKMSTVGHTVSYDSCTIEIQLTVCNIQYIALLNERVSTIFIAEEAKLRGYIFTRVFLCTAITSRQNNVLFQMLRYRTNELLLFQPPSGKQPISIPIGAVA